MTLSDKLYKILITGDSWKTILGGHWVTIALCCGGAAYNPFTQEEDGLGVTILKNMARQIACRRQDGLNRISVCL